MPQLSWVTVLSRFTRHTVGSEHLRRRAPYEDQASVSGPGDRRAASYWTHCASRQSRLHRTDRSSSANTSLIGIPTEELTPKVRVAIETLINEVERLRRELDEVKYQNSHLEKLADENSLLPVINRRAFLRELSRDLSFAQRYTQPSSLAFFDVNNVKTFNDELGHAAGDAALMHVA